MSMITQFPEFNGLPPAWVEGTEVHLKLGKPIEDGAYIVYANLYYNYRYLPFLGHVRKGVWDGVPIPDAIFAHFGPLPSMYIGIYQGE